MSDPQNPQSDPTAAAAAAAAAHHRKRVVAREVSEIELANRQAAAMTPEALMPAVRRETEPTGEPVTVIDPTTLGRRYRRSGHHRVYRWTQGTTLLSALLSTVSIICTLAEDITVARSLAGPAIGIGLVAAALSGRNTLAARWRGWAMAAVLFGAAALAATWIVPALAQDEPTLPKPRQVAPQSL